MNSEVEAQNDVRVEEAKNDVPTEPEQEIKSVADPLLSTGHEEQSASGDPAASKAELSSNELLPETKEVVPPGLPTRRKKRVFLTHYCLWVLGEWQTEDFGKQAMPMFEQ